MSKCIKCVNIPCEAHEAEERAREQFYERLAQVRALNELLAVPLPPIIIGDERGRAGELCMRIIELKLSACGRLQKLIDALPE